MGKYLSIDTKELETFVKKVEIAANGGFKKELDVFMEAIGVEFLRIVQDEIIRLETVDTRLLLNSFQIGSTDSIYTYSAGNFTLEVGTNVKYASYVNDGHWLNGKGIESRFVPGVWNGDKFIYTPGAKTGMVLKQKWIEGSHYWDSAIKIMETMLPGLVEAKIQQWIHSYF